MLSCSRFSDDNYNILSLSPRSLSIIIIIVVVVSNVTSRHVRAIRGTIPRVRYARRSPSVVRRCRVIMTRDYRRITRTETSMSAASYLTAARKNVSPEKKNCFPDVITHPEGRSAAIFHSSRSSAFLFYSQ